MGSHEEDGKKTDAMYLDCDVAQDSLELVFTLKAVMMEQLGPGAILGIWHLTEQQHGWCWKRSLEAVWSNPMFKHGHTQQGVQDCVNSVTSRRLHNLSGRLMPVLYHLHCRKMPPDVQTEPPSFCLYSCLLSSHWMPLKRTWLNPLCTLPSATCIHWWNHPDPFLLQAEQSQLPQCFLTGETLQSLYHFCGP